MGNDNSALPGSEFELVRDFAAPHELVWRVNTELEHLKKWWGPQGFTWINGSLDLRPGGIFHYGMRNPAGYEMWGRFVYREVQPITRVEYIVSFSNEAGEITRAPFNENWPLEVLSDNGFEAHGTGTRVTLRGRPINASVDEEAVYAGFHDSMRKGYAGTMDALDSYLVELQGN
jgi:uncharacterized protein YndB with AHSA1/START domain